MKLQKQGSITCATINQQYLDDFSNSKIVLKLILCEEWLQINVSHNYSYISYIMQGNTCKM